MSCDPIYTEASNPYSKRQPAVQKAASPFSKLSNPFGQAEDPYSCYTLSFLLTETEGNLLLETSETILL